MATGGRLKHPRDGSPERRNLGFERLNAKLGWDALMHEAAARRRDEETSHLTSTRQARTSQELRERQAMKLAKRIRSLENMLADQKRAAKAKGALGDPQYEGAYFVAYERHHPLNTNWAFNKARTRYHLTYEELRALIDNPDMFPNARLVYCLFSNKYRIDWDGK